MERAKAWKYGPGLVMVERPGHCVLSSNGVGVRVAWRATHSGVRNFLNSFDLLVIYWCTWQ
jgi:hypothetical protein